MTSRDRLREIVRQSVVLDMSRTRNGRSLKEGSVHFRELPHLIFNSVQLRNSRAQLLPQTRGRHRPLNRLGETHRITNVEMQAVHPVRNLLGHAAYVTTN